MTTKSTRNEWFSQVAQRLQIPQASHCGLVAEVEIQQSMFQAIGGAIERYLNACLAASGHVTSGQAALETAANELANRTPNGLLMPKKEFQLEFNQLHGALASWLQSIGIDDLIYKIHAPTNVRLVKGASTAQQDSRPYSSTKLHTDIWVGEPCDSLSIMIPVLGDIEKTTVHFYQAPDDFESKYLRLFDDYADAKGLEGRCEKYPITMRMGYAYFMDGAALHKTVTNGGGARLNIQLDFRRLVSDEERLEVESKCDSDRLSVFLDPDDWYALGVTRFMTFPDTYVDATLGKFSARATYGIVNSIEELSN